MARLVAGLLILLALAPAPTIAEEAHDGLQCTIRYPRGFKFTKRDAKLKPCRTLDVDGVVWGRCSRRIPT